VKQIVLCTLGLTPQILTELIYYIGVVQKQKIDELVILTTEAGREMSQSILFEPDKSPLYQLGADWNISWVKNIAQNVKYETIQSISNDFISQNEVSYMQKQVLEIVRILCKSQNSCLHACLAGGRKQLSSALTIAMTLYGRDQDTLSHLIVSQNVVSNPAFFYPPPTKENIIGLNNQSVNSSKANIYISNILFPRLSKLPSECRDLMEKLMSTDSPQPWLDINLNKRQILINNQIIDMPPSLAAWLAWLATNSLNGKRGLKRIGSSKEEYLKFYKKFASHKSFLRVSAILPDILDPEWMEEKTSRINKLVANCQHSNTAVRVIRTQKHDSCLYYILEANHCGVLVY